MKFKLESDFAKHVKSPELLRVYLLMGNQSFLIGRYREQLIKKAVGGDANDFNLHRFDGAQMDLQAFYDAVESVPFLAESRCVTLDADLDKLSSAEIQELCGILEDPPSTTTIIVSLRAESKKEKANALIKACDKAGGVIALEARGRSDTLRFLRNRAQKNGCTLSSDCASYLMERCGDDLQLLATETDKLCAYARAGEITNRQVDEVVSAVLQARVFDLSKAILRGNFSRAMELCDHLFQQREPAARVLAVLSGAFVDLYRGYCARQAGVPAGRAAVELGYAKNREFVLKNAMSDSGRYEPAQLGEMLRILTMADLRLKSTGTNERIVLEHAIAQLFVLTGGN